MRKLGFVRAPGHRRQHRQRVPLVFTSLDRLRLVVVIALGSIELRHALLGGFGHLLQLTFVLGQDRLLDLGAHFAIERVSDVAEGSVFSLLARHSDEEAGISVDDFQVSDDEAVVEDDSDVRLKLIFVDGEDFDFGDFHVVLLDR